MSYLFLKNALDLGDAHYIMYNAYIQNWKFIVFYL